MLKDRFYKILEQQAESGRLHASILIDKDHAILKGHFPEKPIVPGVLYDADREGTFGNGSKAEITIP